MTTYRLMDGASGRPGVGSSGTQPPAAGSAFTGNYLAGTGFKVTQGGVWLNGYWWWCANTGQDTTPVDFALWEITSSSAGIFIPGSHVTSGTLTAGAMNFTALAVPLPLSVNCGYLAEAGYVSATGFPLTQNQFGGSQPYATGITNGPLSAWGQTTFDSFPQGSFSSSNGADPTAGIANSGFNNGNFWADLQVTDQAPPGASYRLWPSMPLPASMTPDTADNFTLATEITLSQSCALNKIWFYSPSGATTLPTETGVFGQQSQALVGGTHNSSPSWSGAAASGWISVSYAGVTLPAGSYRVAVCNGNVSPGIWNNATIGYFTTGQGASGVTTGPLSAPDESAADAPGQGSYNAGSILAWPGTYDSTGGGDSYWVDAEVTPAAAQAATPLYSMRMMP